MGRKVQPAGGISDNKALLSHEKGTVRKKWKGRTPVALIYPNTYDLGMSNLGFQLVYQLLNQDDAVVAERVFLPQPGARPLSIESGRHLHDFPLLFFSVSFEQDYLHLLMLLAMAGMPLLAGDRSRQQRPVASLAAGGLPLVVAGGVAAFMNPEPLAPFVDLFIIGEAEPLLPSLMARLLDTIHRKGKDELLADIGSNLPGCYAPELYQVAYDPAGGFSSITPREGLGTLPRRIKKVTLQSAGETAGHSALLTPLAEFSDLFMTELGRGCSRGCRFCAAGFIYRPPRLWPAQAIINAIDSRPPGTARVGLLGMEMARAEDVSLIADYLAGQSCFLSFSSLRADIINSSLLELLGSSRLKSVTIAPDGGSERLRQVINKGISENDVLAAAETLAAKGLHHLKLYFMLGLPTESLADLDEMVDLIMKVKKKILNVGRSRGRLSTLSLSINCFIPKPWTPFQFHAIEPVAVLKQKLKFIRRKIGGEPNIRLKAEGPEKAFFQAVLARGDRRVGHVLLRMLRDNCAWRQAFAREKIDPAAYALRQRGEREPFPWEIIDHGIERQYLWAEYKRAMQAKTTVPCDTSRCRRCGVC